MGKIGIAELFAKKQKKKPSAAVFVDYEHWYISITKIHGTRPNIKSWAKELNLKYDVKDISFFGDFSNPSLASDILKIREVTNNIIQTSNPGNYKKDFTDFIMLDHIYQKAMFSADIDAFIIFSGDGHFSSAASCLKNNCGKEVGIYGVKDAFSNQLKEIANWFKEVPTEIELNERYFDMIFTNIKEVEKTGRNFRPSFSKTAEHVSGLYGVEEEKIKNALNVLIDNGYAARRETSFGRKKIMVLDFNWNTIEKDGIWIHNRNLKKKETESDTDKKRSNSETPKKEIINKNNVPKEISAKEKNQNKAPESDIKTKKTKAPQKKENSKRQDAKTDITEIKSESKSNTKVQPNKKQRVNQAKKINAQIPKLDNRQNEEKKGTKNKKKHRYYPAKQTQKNKTEIR